MNNKRTNYIIVIFNIMIAIAFFTLLFSAELMTSSMMTGNNEAKSAYGNAVDILLNNIHIIIPVVYGGVGILNIVCSFQNKQNKKLCFWYLVFGLYYIWAVVEVIMSISRMDDSIIEWSNRILLGAVPILLAIINIILIKKHKPKVIQLISYVAVIILGTLILLDIIGAYWNIIAIVMQLIYIHYQEKTIQESRTRKIINIILYYILQGILAIGFFGIVMYSLFVTLINDNMWKKELSRICDNIPALQGNTIQEIYIPVEKNYKYGFISETGEEKILCQYDRVSYFNEIEINDNVYYIAFAKKDDKFYIISKTNDSIEIDPDLGKLMQTIEKFIWESSIPDENKNSRIAHMTVYQLLSYVITRAELHMTPQIFENKEKYIEIDLASSNSRYYYNTDNYAMMIAPTEEDDYFYSDEYETSSEDVPYRVTIAKKNEGTQSSIVYLPGFYEKSGTLSVLANGYIEFETEDHTQKGWYDNNGNQITYSGDYDVEYMENDRIIWRKNNETGFDLNNEERFMITDMNGEILLQTAALEVYNNDTYLVKNSNNKMVLMDKDLKVMTKEYDRILTTLTMDYGVLFSSYNIWDTNMYGKMEFLPWQKLHLSVYHI